jgi:hypothetical protein
MAVRSLKNSTLENFSNYSSSMNAGYSFQDYELIESVFLASNASSVTFNNLNQYATEYKHLQIRTSSRPATGNTNIWIRLNTDSGNNYAWHEIYTYSGGVVTSGAATSQNHIKFNYSSSTPTTNYGAAICDILDAYSSSKNKTLRILTGTLSDTFVALRSGLWINTASLNSITLLTDSADIAAGSRFSLYGIR